MSCYVMLTIASILSGTPEEITGWYTDDNSIATTDMLLNICYNAEDNLTSYMKEKQVHKQQATKPIACTIENIFSRGIVTCKTRLLENDNEESLGDAYFFWVSLDETFKLQAFKHTTICMQQYTINDIIPQLSACFLSLEKVKATIGACSY